MKEHGNLNGHWDYRVVYKAFGQILRVMAQYAQPPISSKP